MENKKFTIFLKFPSGVLILMEEEVCQIIGKFFLAYNLLYFKVLSTAIFLITLSFL